MCFTMLAAVENLKQILKPEVIDGVITQGHLSNEAAAAGGYPVLGSVNPNLVAENMKFSPTPCAANAPLTLPCAFVKALRFEPGHARTRTYQMLG